MEKISPRQSRTIIETVLVLLLLLTLMLALYEVLRVFFGILTFALIFSVSFAAPFEKLVKWLGGRRQLAAVVYSIVLCTLIALPLIYIIGTLRSHVRDAIQLINDAKANGLPTIPKWLSGLPFVGNEVDAFWQELQDSPKETIARHEEHIRAALRHILQSGAGMLGTILQFMAGIIISAFFLVSGQKALYPVKAAAQRLLGRRDGLTLLQATTQAIKGVSIGVMGTALIASIISYIGLMIAHAPFPLALSALIFFLVVIQLGPLIVWIPLIVWAAIQGHTGMMIFLIIYGAALLLIDAVLKPILIAKSGGKIPFLVLFLGVVGGLAAWGFTGMFKGAIILAVFYTVFNSWLGKKPPTESALTSPADQ